MRKLGWVFLACALLALGPTFAVDRQVSTAGTDTGDCAAAACKTIGYAVTQAESGVDVIRVFPGTYNECIDASAKALDFIADAIENGGLASATTIDGTGVCGGKVCELQPGTSCLLDGECATGTCEIPEGETTGACSNAAAVTCTVDGNCENTCVTIGHCSVATATVCATDADCPTDEVCNILGTSAPAIKLGDRSSIKGFTVKGGGQSGVYLEGTGTIEHNVITGNTTADQGGGIYADVHAIVVAKAVTETLSCWQDVTVACTVETEATDCQVCAADHTTVCETGADCAEGVDCVLIGPCLLTKQGTIDHNVVSNNAAEHEGGGVFLWTSADGGGGSRTATTNNTITGNFASAYGGGVFVQSFSLGGMASAEVSDNTISANKSGESGGGIGESSLAWFDASALSSVVITRNVIEGNQAGQDGGGVLASSGTYMSDYFAPTYGQDTVTVASNTLTGNQAERDGGGISTALLTGYNLGPAGNQTLTLNGNTISQNTSARYGGGLDLYLQAVYMYTGGSVAMNATANTVTGNSSGEGGGGINAFLVAYYAYPTSLTLGISKSTISNNTTLYSGGGALLTTYTAGSSSGQTFSHNLVTGNTVHDPEASLGVGGGAMVVLESWDSEVTQSIDFSTFANNVADLGGGAVEVESWTANLGSAELDVSNTIAANNVGYGLGGPVPGESGTFVDSSDGNLVIVPIYSDGYGNSLGEIERTLTDTLFSIGSCVSGTCSNDSSLSCGTDADCNGVITGDPLLDASGVPSMCSATIDTADPGADFSLEPMPNGFRANMGHLGGTVDAVQSLPDVNGDRQVSGADIVLISNAFGATAPVGRAVGDTPYSPALDINRDGIVDGEDLAYVATFYGTDCR
jgi:hypothetical protein